MIVYELYFHGELWLATSDHAYACAWIDRWKRKLGRDHNAGHAEVAIFLT